MPYEAWAAEDPAWSARMDALAEQMDPFGDWLDDGENDGDADARAPRDGGGDGVGVWGEAGSEGADDADGARSGRAGRWGEPGWLTPLVDGDWLTDHAPGPDLAFALARTDPAGLADAYTAVELVAAWARMAAWAQAGMARAAAEVHTRLLPYTTPAAQAPDAPVRGRRLARRAGPAATEIAIRLGTSRPAAQGLIDAGCAYDGPLAPVGDALADGVIDAPRARAFVEGLTRTPAQTALDVVETVLPQAPGRSVGQVRTDIAAALIALDPAGATTRARIARTGRKVNRPQVLPDGMASLYAVMPAVDATALDLALDVAARTARTSGDPRTLDQLRADALAALAHTSLATGHIGPLPHTGAGDGDGDARTGGEVPDCCEHFRLGRIAGRPAAIRVTVPLGVLLGTSDDHAEATANARWGPNSSADTEHDDLTSPPTGQAGRDPMPPAAGPIGTLQVAVLDGYGPITPDVARALALGGTWQRLITDPATGTVHDLGRTRYRPPADLADLIRARDRTCIRPGCGAHATTCDLDHTIPYHLGGNTTPDNLAALCPTDHTRKTDGEYRIDQPHPGVFLFHLPSGHTYRRDTDGTTTMLNRADHSPSTDAGERTGLGSRPNRDSRPIRDSGPRQERHDHDRYGPPPF